MNRILKLLSRGSASGRSRSRRGGRPRGEGFGLIGAARRLIGRR